MTTRKKKNGQLGDCDVCLVPVKAVTEETFTFGAGRYKIKLCDRDADRMLTQFLTWSRAAILVDDDDQGTFRTVERAEAPVRYGRVVRSGGPDLPAHVPVQPKPEDETPPPRKRKPRFDPSLPLNHERWSFTEHAQQRQEERQVSEAEALWCAEAPDTIRPSQDHPGCHLHTRGPIAVVVNRNTYEILTVINRRIGAEEELESQYA